MYGVLCVYQIQIVGLLSILIVSLKPTGPGMPLTMMISDRWNDVSLGYRSITVVKTGLSCGVNRFPSFWLACSVPRYVFSVHGGMNRYQFFRAELHTNSSLRLF